MTSSEERKEKRKTAARKHLIDTLAMKQAGESPLIRRHTFSETDRTKKPQQRSDMRTSQSQHRQFHMLHGEATGYSNRSRGSWNVGGKVQDGVESLPKTSKTFPAINLDLNSSFIFSRGRRQTYQEETDSSSSMSSDQEFVHKKVYTSLSQIRNQSKQNDPSKSAMCWMKHRPLTPNLMDRLNKSKLSSKVQTEQWIRNLPLEKSWQYNSNNSAEQKISCKLDTTRSPFTYRTWIYADTRKPLTGSRFKNLIQ